MNKKTNMTDMFLVKHMYANEDGTHKWERFEEYKLPKKLRRAASILMDKGWRHEIEYAKSVDGFDWALKILWWGGMGWYDVAIARFDSDGRVMAERRVNPFSNKSSWCPTNYSTFMRMYVHDNKGKDQ